MNNLKAKKETRSGIDLSKDLLELRERLESNPPVEIEWLEAKIGELAKTGNK